MNSSLNRDINISVGIMSAEKIEVLFDGEYEVVASEEESSISYVPKDYANSLFSLKGVTIGVDFHWEKVEEQKFRGTLKIVKRDGVEIAINTVRLEDYLLSVISSEMSANASIELLKAHAVISRSWAFSRILDFERRKTLTDYSRLTLSDSSLKWYGGESHADFVVCADDHCQRYQGVAKITERNVIDAVRHTTGEVLYFKDNLCDTRYSKCCGGAFEKFSSCWEDRDYEYLSSGRDTLSEKALLPDLTLESNAIDWISSHPESFCNTDNREVIFQIMNDYDVKTKDFFRWIVTYSREELSEIVTRKSGNNFGLIEELIPLERGISGRIVRLKIVGSKMSAIIGKELEIRRVLSNTHLYSSAFYVERVDGGEQFVLHGAGWGHGVGLCQIGAAMMGERGYGYEEILSHYYPQTSIKNIYK